MAGGTLFTLLDDIASLLDDVATMTKVAAKKTAGVVGDDLALNANQVTGMSASRELPIVWAIAKGSAVNKAILIPAALGLSAISPWVPFAIPGLMMLGGAYLCYEGVEKLVHKKAHQDSHKEHKDHIKTAATKEDLVTLEKEKIKGAVRTDLILSAEIMVLALGTVAAAPLLTQLGVMGAVAASMTVGVYGLVGGIVKLDDVGLKLQSAKGDSVFAKASRGLGGLVLKGAPYLLKGLSIAGTVAMFSVGGGIVAHNIHAVHAITEAAAHAVGAIPVVGSVLAGATGTVVNTVAGVIAGAASLAGINAGAKVYKAVKGSKPADVSSGIKLSSADEETAQAPTIEPSPEKPGLTTEINLREAANGAANPVEEQKDEGVKIPPKSAKNEGVQPPTP